MTSTKHEARVRRALPHEAEALNEVITRSKSYGGYDPSFVEAYCSFLSLSPEAIEHHSVYLLDHDESSFPLFSQL